MLKMWHGNAILFIPDISKYLNLEATGNLTTYKGEVLGYYVLRASNTNNYPAWENSNGYYLFRRWSQWVVGPYLGSNISLVLINHDASSNSPFNLTGNWQYYDYRTETLGYHNVENFKISSYDVSGMWKVRYCFVNLHHFCW